MERSELRLDQQVRIIDTEPVREHLRGVSGTVEEISHATIAVATKRFGTVWAEPEHIQIEADQRTDAEKAADAEDVFKRWLAVVPAGMEWGYAVDSLTEWIAADPSRLAAFRRDHPTED